MLNGVSFTIINDKSWLGEAMWELGIFDIIRKG